MTTDVLLGLQWGDEGKGKVVDYLASEYDIVARFQGGPNAGHTLILEGGKKYVLHTIPSGIFLSNTRNLSGNGVVVDPLTLEQEIQMLEQAGQTMPDSKPILEVNLDHQLLKQVAAIDTDEEFKDWAILLFEQAVLSEGGQLEDPAGFVQRMNRLML